MSGDHDDLGVYQEVAEFYGAKASDEEFASLGVARTGAAASADEGRVVLTSGEATLAMGAAVFAELYRAVWGEVRKDHTKVSSLGVHYIAQAAEQAGYADLVVRLQVFRKVMSGGLAVISRAGGAPWSPPPVSRVPARATAAERDALRGDVEAFLARPTK